MRLERDSGIQVALVETVEVDLEGAPHVGFVVRGAVERRAVDLDGAIVAGRVRRRRCARKPARDNRNDEAGRRRQQAATDQHATARGQHLGTFRHGCVPSPSLKTSTLVRQRVQRCERFWRYSFLGIS
jgi:hypothetical protein